MWSPPPPRPAIAQSYGRTPLPAPRASHELATWSCFSPQRVVDLSFLRLHRYIHSVVRTVFRGEVLCLSPLAPAMLGRKN